MNGLSHGECAVHAVEAVMNQLRKFWPSMAAYNKIIVTPMIGKNDDGTIFSQADAAILAQYAYQAGLFQISYWAAQRDQVGSGDLGLYSEVNKTNFEFWKIFSRTNYV